MPMNYDLMYKGKPLNRKGKQIFYGNTDDRYILVLTVTESTKKNNIYISTKVNVEIQDNSGEPGKGKSFRKTERENLYQALEIGEFWLRQALEA